MEVAISANFEFRMFKLTLDSDTCIGLTIQMSFWLISNLIYPKRGKMVKGQKYFGSPNLQNQQWHNVSEGVNSCQLLWTSAVRILVKIGRLVFEIFQFQENGFFPKIQTFYNF